jgi:hypothetical protein
MCKRRLVQRGVVHYIENNSSKELDILKINKEFRKVN